MVELLPDGTRRLTLSKEHYAEVRAVLGSVYRKAKCKAILLADSSGLLIAECGRMERGSMCSLAALAAGSYAATEEIARLIGEDLGFNVHFHEGAKENVYIAGIDSGQYCLIVIFGKNTTFAMVRVLSAKAAEDLSRILERPNAGEGKQLVDDTVKLSREELEFRRELASRLDDVLKSSKD